MEPKSLEEQIQAKGLTAPRITPAQIDALMARVVYITVSQPGGTTSTFVHAFLDQKFFLATGHSACVSPSNFDAAIGEQVAMGNAKAAAKSRLWELEGYRLYASLQA
jgi:hypothetical protein